MTATAPSLAQTWWAPLAAILAVSNAVTGTLILANEQNPGSIVGGSCFLAGPPQSWQDFTFGDAAGRRGAC